MERFKFLETLEGGKHHDGIQVYQIPSGDFILVYHQDVEIPLSLVQAMGLGKIAEREGQKHVCVMCKEKIQVGWGIAIADGKQPVHKTCVLKLATVEAMRDALNRYAIF